MASNALLRERVEKIQAKAKEDREWWDRKRETTQAEFLKELDEDKAASSSAPVTTQPSAAPSAPATVLSTPSRPSTSGSGKVPSDEDAVLVESGGPTSPATPGLPGGGKGGKKKKGKK
jgi:translocation protein SEC66